MISILTIPKPKFRNIHHKERFGQHLVCVRRCGKKRRMLLVNYFPFFGGALVGEGGLGGKVAFYRSRAELWWNVDVMGRTRGKAKAHKNKS